VADAIKVLGQLDPSATTATTLYTVPNLTFTTVSSLVICNRTGSGVTYRVSVRVAGASADDKQYIFYDKALAANSTDAHVIGITLNQADVVTIYASGTNLSFSLFGVETT
jgi:hypothetical protein|tara:strand:+ start:212 stop:541 length:330 start_codon:yes stop_codon:yes gene_type:complete